MGEYPQTLRSGCSPARPERQQRVESGHLRHREQRPLI